MPGVEIKDAGALDSTLTGAELIPFQEPGGGPGSTKHTTAQDIADLGTGGGGGGAPDPHAASHGDGGSDEVALDGSQITTGTVADARIASTLARDSEVTSAVASEASARDAAIAAAIAALVASAPGVLDTLDEIAAALGDDPNFATTITTSIATKVAKSLYDANTILKADSDDTPAALTIGEQTIVGRKTGGSITALTAAEVRTLLALVIGTNVQAWDGDLDTLAANISAFGQSLVDDANAAAALTTLGLDADLATFSLPATTTISAFGASLVDDAAASNARTTLGLGTAATSNTGDFDAAGAAATVDAALTAHVNDTSDAHDASAISILDTANDFTATDVEGALAELQTADEADEAALAAHLADTADAHDASAISFVPNGSIAATDVQAAIVEVRDEAAGGGAPSTADYLVGTANGGLSAEIVVGTTPGGELGGTWASPTVDATHSGSSHAAVQAAAEATAANATNLTSGTVNIARLPIDADVATLSLPASTTISSFVAATLDETTVGAFLTALGVDADLATLAVPASTTISSFVAGALDETTIAAFLTALGLDADIATLSLPASTTITTFGASLVDDANAAAAIATLGLDADIATLALPASTTISAFGASLIDDAAASNARTTLGLGTAATNNTGDFDTAGAAAAAQAASQPLDTDLTTIAGLTATTDNMIQSVGSAWASRTPAQVRTALGLVIGTNVQAFDADLSTYAGITPGALGQAILPMTTLTDKGIVLGRAAAAPAALAPDAGTTKFLKNSVASGDPTWQAIAESDVTNLVSDLAAAGRNYATRVFARSAFR